MKEIWKFYKNAGKSRYYKKGTYFYVSNFGRVRADGEIIKPYANKRGYMMFCHKPLHRIVYEMFVGKIPEGYEIDHIDTNPSNNRFDNLRCVTKKENRNNPLTKKHYSEATKGDKNPMYGKKGEKSPNYGKRHSEESRRKMSLNHADMKGEKNHRSKPIQQIDKQTGEIIKTWPCAMEVQRELGINHSSIYMCCSGKTKSSGGYVWKYVV